MGAPQAIGSLPKCGLRLEERMKRLEVTLRVLAQITVRALDNREYLVIIRDNVCQFCAKTYVGTPHLNRLDETVQMRGHPHMVSMRYKKLSLIYHQILLFPRALYSYTDV